MASNYNYILTRATIDGVTYTCIATEEGYVVALNQTTGFTVVMTDKEWAAKL
jgi:CMP-2-keto-3-deoxyoctulosonic acid synthetase